MERPCLLACDKEFVYDLNICLGSWAWSALLIASGAERGRNSIQISILNPSFKIVVTRITAKGCTVELSRKLRSQNNIKLLIIPDQMCCQHLCHIMFALMPNIEHHQHHKIKSGRLLYRVIAKRVQVYPHLISQLICRINFFRHVGIQQLNTSGMLQYWEVVQVHQSSLKFVYVDVSV